MPLRAREPLNGIEMNPINPPPPLSSCAVAPPGSFFGIDPVYHAKEDELCADGQ